MIFRYLRTTAALLCVFSLTTVAPLPALQAQTPPPLSQRQLLDQLTEQLRLLEVATRNAHTFNTAADVVLWRHFEGVTVGFQVLTQSLSPAQLQAGANDLADLEAGLTIMNEAFSNFQEDLKAGRSADVALRSLCQFLRESFKLWTQQLSVVSRRLQIGR